MSINQIIAYLLIAITAVGSVFALRYALNNTAAKRYARERARERARAEARKAENELEAGGKGSLLP